MAGTFVVLWTQSRCRRLTEVGDVDKPLTVLFGGSHQSAPRFSSFGVQVGDAVCPVHVHDGTLYVVARLQVERILPVADYLSEFVPLSKAEAALPAWQLQDELWRTRLHLGHRRPDGCVDEAVVGTGDAPIRLTRSLSASELTALRFTTRKGEVRALKYVVNGKLLRVSTLQGRVYRLDDASATMCAEVLEPTSNNPEAPPTGYARSLFDA